MKSHPQPFRITVYGTEMFAWGAGAYPYECEAQDTHPDAMIYLGASGGWCSDQCACYLERDRSLDEDFGGRVDPMGTWDDADLMRCTEMPFCRNEPSQACLAAQRLIYKGYRPEDGRPIYQTQLWHLAYTGPFYGLSTHGRTP